jgi:hypothetical protein
MRRVSVLGRDKPHSLAVGVARGSAREAPEQERSFALAIGLGLMLAALLVAVSPLPVTPWTRAEHPVASASAAPLGWLWDALLLALPVAERGLRGEIATLLLALAVAAAAGFLCARLYRGTGRALAATTAVPLTMALLLVWLRGGPADAATALASSLAATLAVAIFLGARVRGRAGDGSTWARGGVALLGAVLLAPRFGAGLAALLLGHAAWHQTPGRGPLRALRALAPVVLLGLWIWSSGHVFMDMRIDLAGVSGLARRVGPALVYPALALLVLLVLPLRWRGGGALLGLSAAALVLVDRAGPLAPEPMRLTLVAVAACGWVWLAGSVGGDSRRRWLARCGAGLATTVLLGWIAWRREVVDEPAAALRPASLLALQQRGLIAPGDVLLAHEPWLVAAFAAAQRDEGLRPDVALYAAAALDPEGLSERLAAWARSGRRVLSDSFSYGGRWRADWVLDSGPLFWFVGTADADAHQFTDVRVFAPDLDDPALTPEERARWERLQLERARHRRALGRHDEAVQALPLEEPDLAELTQQLQRARLSRLPAVEGSELGPGPWPSAPPPASALAEAGDLLLALGDGRSGAARLEEAAALGVAEAFAALARWQLRAGEEEAARATLTEIAMDPELRPQLLDVCRWLLVRGRARQAAEVLAGAAPAMGHAPEELGLRLAVLRGLAAP